MATRERILEAALRGFNSTGTAQLSCVEIANELEISPGNLYYHFRGKEEILTALLAELELALRHLYRRFIEDVQQPEDLQPYLLSLLQIGYHFRFVFRDQACFRFGDRALQQSWRLTLRQIRNHSQQMFRAMIAVQPLPLPEPQQQILADSLLLYAFASLSFEGELQQPQSIEQLLLSTADAIALMLKPYDHPAVRLSEQWTH